MDNDVIRAMHALAIKMGVSIYTIQALLEVGCKNIGQPIPAREYVQESKKVQKILS